VCRLQDAGSGMLALGFIEQLAWDELSGEAEESAQEAAGTGEAAGKLRAVGGAGIVDARVDEGTDPGTDTSAKCGSCEDRSGRVVSSDLMDVRSGEGEGAIDSGLPLVTDDCVLLDRVEGTESSLPGERDADRGAGLEGLEVVPVFGRLLGEPHRGGSEEEGEAEHKV
jgi:hypothetical protein